jgi:DNA-binding transcriptional ArsR family regulator
MNTPYQIEKEIGFLLFYSILPGSTKFLTCFLISAVIKSLHMIHFNSGDQLLTLLEALSNPQRLKIIAVLSEGEQYVSQLARELGISRPLLYLHLKKLEEANIVSSDMEILESGKAAKYYMLNSFHFEMNEKIIHELAPTLTMKKKS